MDTMTFCVPCLFGLEGLVGDELRRPRWGRFGYHLNQLLLLTIITITISNDRRISRRR